MPKPEQTKIDPHIFVDQALKQALLLHSTALSRLSSLLKLPEVLEPSSAANISSAGYHGTSIYGLLRAVELGHFPISKSRSGEQFDGLYFAPSQVLQKKFFESRNERPIDSGQPENDRAAFKSAKGYAMDATEDHFLVKTLGLDLTNARTVNLASDLFDHMRFDRACAELCGYNPGLDAGRVKILTDYLDKSKYSQGVLLELKIDIFEELKVVPAQVPDEGFRIVSQPGLPIEFISGISFLGATEKDIRNSLKGPTDWNTATIPRAGES